MSQRIESFIQSGVRRNRTVWSWAQAKLDSDGEDIRAPGCSPSLGPAFPCVALLLGSLAISSQAPVQR
jgi:hypothetical protein